MTLIQDINPPRNVKLFLRSPAHEDITFCLLSELYPQDLQAWAEIRGYSMYVVLLNDSPNPRPAHQPTALERCPWTLTNQPKTELSFNFLPYKTQNANTHPKLLKLHENLILTQIHTPNYLNYDEGYPLLCLIYTHITIKSSDMGRSTKVKGIYSGGKGFYFYQNVQKKLFSKPDRLG